MFAMMQKHLYLGQTIDGYSVVSFNTSYTGGLMRSPLINPRDTWDENYADSLNTIINYNSGSSVNIYGGGTATTAFNDWRLPTKDELDIIVNLYDNVPYSITPSQQTIWTGTGAPLGNVWCMESGVGGYSFQYYDASSTFSLMLVRSFTI